LKRPRFFRSPAKEFANDTSLAAIATARAGNKQMQMAIMRIKERILFLELFM
jgi:hypothetical protein